MTFPPDQSQRAYVDRVVESSVRFFDRLGGEIIEICLPSHPTKSYLGESATCPILFVEFENANLLGSGDFFEEVYKRYRKIRLDWWEAMETAGIAIHIGPYAVNRPHFVPILSKKHTFGKPYAKLDRGFSL